MNNISNKLSCLYYPFSRLLDSVTLKYLLLVFDSITFLDQIESSEWRRVQLQMMSREDNLFSSFEELSDDYDMLSETQAVQVLQPKNLKAVNSNGVALATIADLSDHRFIDIASKPSQFGLPYRPLGAYHLSPEEKPTWQIFQSKIARPLLESKKFLEDQNWSSHVLIPGNEWQHWALSYEAGSAVSINFYLEAAQELQLTPVTTSQLHHELILRKLKRIFADDDNKITYIDNAERKRFRAILSHGEIIRLLGNIFPISQMDKIAFREILKFRNETQEFRHKFVTNIDEALRVIDENPKNAKYDSMVIQVMQKLKEDFKKLESDLIDIRDKILPVFSKSLMYGTAGGGALGSLVSFLGGLSWEGIVLASTLTISGAFLTDSIKLWNEKRKTLRSQSAAVSYLTKVSKFVKSAALHCPKT